MDNAVSDYLTAKRAWDERTKEVRSFAVDSMLQDELIHDMMNNIAWLLSVRHQGDREKMAEDFVGIKKGLFEKVVGLEPPTEWTDAEMSA